MRRVKKIRKFGWIAGGSMLVLGGCDATVRDTVLGGVEGAATTLSVSFIQAFFQSLVTQDEGPATIVHSFASSDAIFS